MQSVFWQLKNAQKVIQFVTVGPNDLPALLDHSCEFYLLVLYAQFSWLNFFFKSYF